MNIVVLCCGTGERFREQQYAVPKPLIRVQGTSMLQRLLDSLLAHVQRDEDWIFVPYLDVLEQYPDFQSLRRHYRRDPVCFEAVKQTTTRSPVESLQIALSRIPFERRAGRRIVSLDCDSFFLSDVLGVIRAQPNARHLTLYKESRSPDPIYSYIALDEADGRVLRSCEKVKISDWANIGCYVFTESIVSFLSPADSLAMVLQRLVEANQEPVFGVRFEHSVCVGTPFQLQTAPVCPFQTPLRFCFDLDQTLVTQPIVDGEYSTVAPIPATVDFLRLVKSLGHTVIIYTARRMRTHCGDVGRVVADIGETTLRTLRELDIPYDEIYFGKPYADFYIDDKATGDLANVAKWTGFYPIQSTPRHFNRLEFRDSDNRVVKTSSRSLQGEIFWYTHIPTPITDLFPTFHGASGWQQYTLEYVRGMPVSFQYCQQSWHCDRLRSLLATLDRIHESSSVLVEEQSNNLYSLYAPKLRDRQVEGPCAIDVEAFLLHQYEQYEQRQLAVGGVIHGDPVLSNVLIPSEDPTQFKFIDMRGEDGFGRLTVYGDRLYDYAKVYQSLLGYDFVLTGAYVPRTYTRALCSEFERLFCARFGLERWSFLRILTLGLLFTLLPLHDTQTRPRLHEFMLDLYSDLRESSSSESHGLHHESGNECDNDTVQNTAFGP